MTALPLVSVGYNGSLSFQTDQPLTRAQALVLATDLIHGHAESRGLDAVKGIASDVPDEAYIFIFGEFQKVDSVLRESNYRTCIQWTDTGFLNEVTIHEETEVWWYVPAQG